MGSHARLDESVLEALQRYDFPGNVRELEHMVEQAVALVQDGVVTKHDLMLAPASTPSGFQSPRRALADIVDSAERHAIESALRESAGSRERAAELLGISGTTLWRKMTRLGVTFDFGHRAG